VAYSKANEIIIPDMFAPELGNAFELGDKARPYDRERYRSMAAIPIVVGGGTAPWGAAIATSSRPGHFHDEHVDGVATAEPIRAIAAMTALAVKALTKLPNSPVISPGGRQAERANDGAEREKLDVNQETNLRGER
jgi:GAF domain-containing protein